MTNLKNYEAVQRLLYKCRNVTLNFRSKVSERENILKQNARISFQRFLVS